jgi:small basic protein
MNYQPTSSLNHLVGLCLSLLVAATAVYVAVRLIEAVWTALLIILGVGLFITVGVLVLRSRRNSW